MSNKEDKEYSPATIDDKINELPEERKKNIEKRIKELHKQIKDDPYSWDVV